MNKMLASAMASTLALAFASPAISKTYDCQIGPPQALYRDGDTATLKTINFPHLKAETWSFKVDVKGGGKGVAGTAVVKWPSNPIQIAGSFPLLETADGAIAFTAVGGGPCMFTSYSCLATVQIAEQAKGKAKISILPTALWKDDATGTSDPFVAILDGTCTWKDNG